jgi:hypothetical protein
MVTSRPNPSCAETTMRSGARVDVLSGTSASCVQPKLLCISALSRARSPKRRWPGRSDWADTVAAEVGELKIKGKAKDRETDEQEMALLEQYLQTCPKEYPREKRETDKDAKSVIARSKQSLGGSNEMLWKFCWWRAVIRVVS